MHQQSSFLKILGRVLLALVATLLVGVVGEYFIELAKEQGLYDSPTSRLVVVMTHLNELVTDSRFLFFLAFFVGAFLGAWLDKFFWKRDEKYRVDTISFDLKGLANDAGSLARRINKIIADNPSKPPTHPDFSVENGRVGVDEWQRASFNSRERALRAFKEECEASFWQIIEKSDHFGVLPSTKKDIAWKVSNAYDQSALSSAAQVLAQIEARIGLTLAGEISLPQMKANQGEAG